MDRENILYKMRSIHLQVLMAYNYIQAKLKKEEKPFIFIEKNTSISSIDAFYSWQLEMNIEMIFVKLFVFLEFLRELNMSREYKIDQKLLTAGLRTYITHKGTHKDCKMLCLPYNIMVVSYKIEIVNNEIFFTLLSGNHTEKLSAATTHKINLTEKIFKPHFNFIKEKYPNWLI